MERVYKGSCILRARLHTERDSEADEGWLWCSFGCCIDFNIASAERHRKRNRQERGLDLGYCPCEGFEEYCQCDGEGCGESH